MPVGDLVGWAREAIVYEPLWPSVAAASVVRLLPMINMEIHSGTSKEYEKSSDATHTGYVGTPAIISKLPTFNLNMPLRYEGFDDLFAAVLGLEPYRVDGTIMPEEIDTLVYRHQFEVDRFLGTSDGWQIDEDGIEDGDIDIGQRKVRRGTVAVRRSNQVWEFLSTMINQMSFGWSASENHCNIACSAFSYVTNSVINTAATLNKAMPNMAPTVMLHHCTLYAKPFTSTDPFDAGDKIRVRAFNFTVQNNFATDQGPGSEYSCHEFERVSEPVIVGSFTFNRLRTTGLEADIANSWHTSDLWTILARFVGPVIPGSAETYGIDFYFPGISVTQSDPSGPSAAATSVPIQWFAQTPDAMPVGIPVTARLGPLVLHTVNRNSRHSLL